jgi:hypothetical protein
MPWFPNPNGGAPIQAATNPNPAGGSYGLYSDPSYSGPAPGSGGSSPGAGAAAPASGGVVPASQTGANLAAGQLLLSQAQQAAYQAYLNSKLALDTDQEAYQKAAQEAATVLAQAGVTGTFQGMPTQAAIKQAADIASQQAATMTSYATNFGVWGTPQPGQETLAAQKQAYDLANQTAQQTGYYQAPGYTPGSYLNDPATGAVYYVGQNGQVSYIGDPKAIPAGANIRNVAGLGGPVQTATGWVPSSLYGSPGGPGASAGQPVETLAAWQAHQTAAQNYMTMMAGLRGPADWAQYQKVLGATPQGTQDLVRAAAGQYIPGGGATTGVQPQGANLNTFYNQLTGQQPGGSGQQQLTNMQNTLVAPNQMAPQTWNALQPSQQQMLLGVWESQGYSQEDAKNLFNQSLPKYATSAPSGGAFRLQ